VNCSVIRKYLYFVDLTTFQILGQKFVKFFVGILVQTMTPKGHFEINWPLVHNHTSPRLNFNLIFLFNSSNDFAPIPILGPVVCVDHTLTPFKYGIISEGVFNLILSSKNPNQNNVPQLFTLQCMTKAMVFELIYS
jgi:hypothetical protein